VWQVLPSVGDKKLPDFAFAGSCTLSEYFPSSYYYCCCCCCCCCCRWYVIMTVGGRSWCPGTELVLSTWNGWKRNGTRLRTGIYLPVLYFTHISALSLSCDAVVDRIIVENELFTLLAEGIQTWKKWISCVQTGIKYAQMFYLSQTEWPKKHLSIRKFQTCASISYMSIYHYSFCWSRSSKVQRTSVIPFIAVMRHRHSSWGNL